MIGPDDDTAGSRGPGDPDANGYGPEWEAWSDSLPLPPPFTDF